MKTEIYNVEGIEIEVERTSKDDTEAERRKMAYSFKMIREQSGMNRKDFSDWLGILIEQCRSGSLAVVLCRNMFFV